MKSRKSFIAAMIIAMYGIIVPGCVLFPQKSAPENIGWTELLVAMPELYTKHECMQRVPPNILKKKGYEFPAFSGWPGVAAGMHAKFLEDKSELAGIIIGDSTAHGWQTVVGLTAGWRNTAVGGNRICNMIAQSRKYHKDKIKRVIISTNGGNDILAGSKDQDLLNDIRGLLARVRVLYPKARITVVGVHPVMLDGYYSKIRALNAEVAKLSKELKFCHVDTHKVLGVAKGGILPAKYRLKLDDGSIDQIHYNEHAAKAVFKAAVNCK